MTGSKAAIEVAIDAASGVEAGSAPRIQILGEASPEQVAALVAVLSGLGSDPAPEPVRSLWAHPRSGMRLSGAPASSVSFGASSGWASSAR